MTRLGAGTTVSTTVELRRLNSVSAAAVAVFTIASKGAYKSTTVGKGVYQFSRVYRPRWATISGWFFTIGLLGAGYWILLIKRTEACTMWVSEDRATVRVTLAGRLLPEAYAQLRSAFDALECTTGPSSDVNEPERGAFDASDDMLPYRPFRSQRTVTPAVIDLHTIELEEIVVGEDVLAEEVRAPVRSRAAVMDVPVVEFDTGERVRVMGVTYVGRDPMHTDANGTVIERFAVAGANDRVSKTHFAMGASVKGLWVEDLFSPTGTSVGVDAQSATRIRPMERVLVPPNERIFFGDQSAVVLPAVYDDSEVGLPRSSPSARV